VEGITKAAATLAAGAIKAVVGIRAAEIRAVEIPGVVILVAVGLDVVEVANY
jgi:hypothetical protein